MTADPIQLTPPRRPIILGIGGCSGSGKTTLARELTTELAATLLSLDFFYRDLSHFPPPERAEQNFDHPDSIDSALLVHQLETLASGHAVDRPVYDFATHTRLPHRTERIEPADILIVEGILALHYPSLRRLYDLSIYVDAPHDLCLARRIARDLRERGRTEISVREQYEATTRPMADLFVLPSAAHASITVDGSDPPDRSVAQTLQLMRRLGLYL